MPVGAPADDATVADKEALWRRICPAWIVPDSNAGSKRISSAAFDDSRDGTPTSVLLVTIVKESGRTSQDVLAAFRGYGLAALTAGDARECHQGITREPSVPTEPAHAYVVGPKTKSNRRCLARKAMWVVQPDDGGQ